MYKDSSYHHRRIALKVPKHEIFSLTFFALSKTIWGGVLGTEPKNPFFFQLSPDFDGIWFFAAH
jgi:hypothetical protein